LGHNLPSGITRDHETIEFFENAGFAPVQERLDRESRAHHDAELVGSIGLPWRLGLVRALSASVPSPQGAIPSPPFPVSLLGERLLYRHADEDADAHGGDQQKNADQQPGLFKYWSELYHHERDDRVVEYRND
jgi:hypothetical protein